jgi:chitinase
MPAGPQLATKYNVASSIQQYLDAGVPAAKLCMGLPFYGRSWRGVPGTNNGLFQPGTGPAPGTWDDWSSGVTGVNDFTQIRNTYQAPGSGYVRYWDAVSQSPWLYSPSAYGGHFVGFDDEQSIALKIDWANDHGLGGAMFWDFTGDRDEVLLDAIGAGLGAQPFR